MRVLVIIAIVVCAAPAAAQPSEAERLYHDGQRAYDTGRFDDAVAAWEKSYQLSKLPPLLFNIAQAYRLRAWSGDCTRSVDAYRRFIAGGQAEGFLAELGPCAEAERAANPAPAPATPAQPPRIDVDAGRGKRLLAYGSGATGAVLVGVGIYYGHRASTLSAQVHEACSTGCTFADVAAKDAEGRSADRKQWVFYGVGAAGLVAGGVLYWMAGRERAPAIAVAPHADGAIVTFTRLW